MPDRCAIRIARNALGRFAVALLLLAAGRIALAYGPEGHLIAGQVAEGLLCKRASIEVAVLGGDEDLGELGLWADRIRSDRAYADSAPWHYMNIPDDAPLSTFDHPPEGDVLWAIDYFAGRLRDESLGRAERAEALKFLVHFIVDIHQPLHVGLADDRGGNSVQLRYRGAATNLHRLWDTHAIDWAELSIGSYRRSVRQNLRNFNEPVSLDPRVWAEESLALRPAVYDFGGAGREPGPAYMDFAASTTRDRLTAAARRLAATLNAVWCD